jgi:hypothetical protein
MDRIFPLSLQERWRDPRGLIQVFTGPRQVGKTTAVLALTAGGPAVYASADLPTPPTTDFIVDHWKKARLETHPDRTLVLDEVQKIPRWSEVVKSLWEEDRRAGLKMRVCLLGSSALLIEKGLSESLTGRFEVNYFPHWTYGECRRAFGATLADYVSIGGYPKSYDLRGNPDRLERYLQDSILEPTLGRDILSLHAIDKPALLRQLFWYVSRLPARIVSFEKILGELQGRGNSATLVHYAELLSMAFLLKPISKFSPKPHRTKRSLPKWILPNPGLVDAAVKKEGLTGFVFENLVGSHLANVIYGKREYEMMYWREGSEEIDFILTRRQEPIAAFEVKSGRPKNLPDETFLIKKGIAAPLKLISPRNLEDFLLTTSVEEMIGGRQRTQEGPLPK